MDWRFSTLVKAFVSPHTSVGDLDAGSAAALIAAASDVALIIGADGVIQDTAFQSEDLLDDLDGGATWLGRALVDTVAPDSRSKVEALLRDAATNAELKWRHVNHVASNGRSVAVLYCCVALGRDGRVVAFGRDLRALSALQQRLMNAQQSMERDYSRLRDVETRYRLLFQTSSEAVLILDPAKQRVVEANPAARELFGETVGRTMAELLDHEGAALIQPYLRDAQGSGQKGSYDGEPTDGVRLRLPGRGEVVARASSFRQAGAPLLILRISDFPGAPSPSLPDVKAKLLRAVESAPDGFIVTDHQGVVVTANAAFLNMACLATEEQARGEPLDRWIGHSGVDLSVLMSNLRQRGSVRFFSTVVRGEDGGDTQVEISAVSITNGGQPSFGFAIRNVGPRLQVEAPPARTLPRSLEQLSELIGRVALKDLVRESTEVIERMCIEAALEMTGDNRASAAELLGLSRQSFYVKMRRYGLGDLASAGQA